jgi:glycosyltransferase involved in cell wall biosynthesis
MSAPAAGPSILAFAPGPWWGAEVAGSTRYHLWELARRGWQVLYVESPQRLLRRRRTWIAEDRSFVAFGAPWVPPFAVRYCPPAWPGEAWRAATSHCLARQALLRAAERNLRPDIVWYGAPWHGRLHAMMQQALAPLDARLPLAPPPLHVFHVYDDLAASPILSPRRQRLLAEWERALVQACDATLCSSQPQLDARAPHARHAVLVQNAVADAFVDACERATPPPEHAELVARLTAIPGPRLVYGGVVDLRLDGGLLRATLGHFPDAHLILLGNAGDAPDRELREIMSQHPRVHLFGRTPHGAYPALYAHADVLLLPHREIAFTRGMYAEKLNEYLAAGRPIVGWGLAETWRLAAEAGDARAIRVATTVRDWLDAVREALGERDEALVEMRRALARRHTWSIESQRLDGLLRGLLAPRAQAPA